MGLTAFGGPEVLRELSLDPPICGEREVLIRVEDVSVNYADLQTRRGAYHAGGNRFPVIPGLDAAGTVVEAGPGVKCLRAGQRVIAFPHTGTYAEYVTADEALAFPVPDDLPWEQAAACPLVCFTAHMLLHRVARLERGETLLLHAASGGVGAAAIQLAREAGAGKIIGTVGSRRKVQAALDAGADEVLCLEAGGFSEKVLERTGGRGADVILDSLGGRYTAEGMTCLAPYGRMAVFGNASGAYSGVDTGLLHASCRALLGFSIGSTRRMHPEWFAETAGSVLESLRAGRLRIPVSARFPLEEAAGAHALLERREITGKVLLTVRR